MSKLSFRSEAGHTPFAVADDDGKGWDVNFGIGHGWTNGADHRVAKMILGLPF